MSKTNYSLESLKTLIDSKKEYDISEFCYYEIVDSPLPSELYEVILENIMMYKQIQTLENYNILLKSGMFWEFHPELTGDWDKDKIIINGVGSLKNLKKENMEIERKKRLSKISLYNLYWKL